LVKSKFEKTTVAVPESLGRGTHHTEQWVSAVGAVNWLEKLNSRDPSLVQLI
jgi:hypothetical protein